MPNNSSTGGYLEEGANPPWPTPLEGAALNALLTGLVVGTTGLDGTLVRPRWQPTPPVQPDVSVDWCAIGVINRKTYDYAEQVHDGDANGGDGVDYFYVQQDLEVLASFYGPDCQDLANQLRDAVYVPQNLEAIEAQGLTLTQGGDVKAVPELINQQWVNRADVTITFRREVIRTYPILNILTASGEIDTGVYSTTFEN